MEVEAELGLFGSESEHLKEELLPKMDHYFLYKKATIPNQQHPVSCSSLILLVSLVNQVSEQEYFGLQITRIQYVP